MFVVRFDVPPPSAGLHYDAALWQWRATCERCGVELEGYVASGVGERMDIQLKNHEDTHVNATVRRIIAFQRAHGLIEDGIAGPATLAKGYQP